MNLKFKKREIYFFIFSFILSFFFFTSNSLAATVNQTGAYTSDIKDFSSGVQWGTMSWTTSNGGTVSVKVRSCNDSACSGESAFASCTAITNSGDDISANSCVNDGDRYLQYQVNFSADYDDTVSDTLMTLDSVVTNYIQYTSGANSLIGSKYSASVGNIMGGVGWKENTTLLTGTKVGLYLRTASSESGLTGNFTVIATSTPSSLTSGCTKISGVISCDATTIPSAMKSGSDDNWFQYMIILDSNGANTPTVDDIQITYVVNAPPEFNPDYPTTSAGGFSASQGTDGQITIAYSIKDSDTTTGAYNGYVVPTYYYSLDNGSNWTQITSGLSAGATSNKTVNENSYTEYTGITWNPKSMIDDNYSSTAKIKVSINDGEAANNTTDQASTAFILDTTDPVGGSPVLIIKATSTPAFIDISATDNSAMQMKLGLVSNLSDATWVTYNTTSTLSLATDPDTVYVQFKDYYNNTSTVYSLDTITTPTFMMIQDTSNTSIPEYREFISWAVSSIPPAGFGSYRVLRSTSQNSGYSIIRIETDRSINSYDDSSVSANTTYYYKVALVDSNGATSYLTTAISGKANGVQDLGEGGGGTSTDIPTINGNTLAVSNINTTGATIVWDTTDSFGSDSLVEYITGGGGDFSSASSQGVATLANNASALGSHSVTLTGLSPDTTYYLQIKSANTVVASPLVDSYKFGVNGTSFTTSAGPAISNISSGTPTTTAATITWTTSKSSDSYVYYSTAADMSGSVRVGSQTAATSHSVALSDLAINTTYYYYITSTDSEANTATDNNSSNYYSFTTAADSSAPTISSISSTATTNTVTITWTTDELSDSQVDYATASYYNGNGNTYSNTSVLDATLTRNHAVTLSSLTPGVTYHFQVKSSDSSNNLATSSDNTFTLSGNPPEISVISVSSVTTSGATITWTTDKSADSVVEYITTNDGDYSNAPSQGSSAGTTSHSVALTGLSPNTTYYFRARSTDGDGNSATKVYGSSFSTDSGASITVDPAVSVTQSTAIVTWTTDIGANSYVYYSTATSTMSTATRIGTSATSTAHSVEISGLSLNTLYYYYVQSTDVEGNTTTSNNSGNYWYFSTSDDSTPPTIIDYSVVAATSTATITWTTNELSTSQVIYDKQSNYETDASLDSGPNKNTTLTIEHSIVLTNLTAGTSYYFSLLSADARSNEVQSEVLAFTTVPETAASCPACPVCRSGGGGISACARLDKIAPVISNLHVANITSDSAKIIWKTNEKTSGLVKFGQDKNPEKNYSNIQGNNDIFNTDHVLKLINLLSSTDYYYQVFVVDKSGNAVKSDILKFSTVSLSQGLIKKAKKELINAKNPNEVNKKKKADTLLKSSVAKINDIISKYSDVLSVNVLEKSLKNSLSNIESLVPAPTIQGVPEVIINKNKVIINWKTNKETNSIVSFVPENKYDATLPNPYLYQTGDSTLLTTIHSVTIPNLLSNTIYRYKVVSKPQVGPPAILDNLKFATAKEIPEVTSSQIEKITDFTATITWLTNLPTDSLIKYVPLDEETNKYLSEKAQVQGKAELVKNHIVILKHLDPGTTYKLTLQGKDENGTAYEFDMGDLNTSKDVRPPVITNIKTESSVFPNQKDKIQSVVTWLTDEDATTQVAYVESKGDDLNDKNLLAVLAEQKNYTGKGEFKPAGPIKLSKLDNQLAQKHIMVITKFKPSKVYKFRTISVDPSGNISLSPIFVTLTPQQKETVLEMIIKTFETRFSWMNKLQK